MAGSKLLGGLSKYAAEAGMCLQYIFGGCQRFSLQKFSKASFLVAVVDQMILGSVGCPSRIQCTNVFAP